jgi:MFS family permease
VNSDQDTNAEIENPLPTTQVATIAIVSFVNLLNMVIIFPFLPFYTAKFFPDLDTSEIGGYVGLLASAYFFGDMLGSFFWGTFADKYGRKVAVELGLVTSTIGLLAFSFAKEYQVALTIRFLTGLLCGNSSLTRTMMSESCDNTNLARGLSILGMATGLARLFAPAIGGVLALPVTKYPSIFHPGGINEEYPFFLPCAIGAGITLFGQILTIFFLKETMEPAPTVEDPPAPAALTDSLSPPSVSLDVHDLDLDLEAVATVEEDAEARKGVWSVVMQPAVLNVLLIFFMHSLVGMASHEIMPVWVVNSLDDHGFMMDTTQVGIMLALIAPFQIYFQFVIYPYCTPKLGFIKMFRVCSMIYGCAIFILPFCAYANRMPSYVTWPMLIVVMAVTNCSRIGAFTCIYAFLSNSCHKQIRASVNAVGQVASSAGRMMGPSLTNYIFAWSLSNNMPFPFNFHLAFMMLAGMCLLTWIMSRKFDKSLNYQKSSPEARAIRDPQKQVSCK